MRTAPVALAGVAVVAVLGTAGCGGGGSRAGVATLTGRNGKATTTTTVSKQSAQKRWNEFAACMRQHGVNMADPVLNNDGLPTNGINITAGHGPRVAGLQAGQACQSQLEAAMRGSGKSGRAPSPADQARAEKFSKCMRAHGLPDFPDPQTGGGGGIRIQGGGQGSSSALSPDSPVFRRAQKACASLLPGKAGLQVTRP